MFLAIQDLCVCKLLREHHYWTEEVPKGEITDEVKKGMIRRVEGNLPMQYAMASCTASRDIDAREKAKKGYMYDSYKKDIDREISEEQHEETIACMQEKPGWLGEVRDARDRCI